MDKNINKILYMKIYDFQKKRKESSTYSHYVYNLQRPLNTKTESKNEKCQDTLIFIYRHKNILILRKNPNTPKKSAGYHP